MGRDMKRRTIIVSNSEEMLAVSLNPGPITWLILGLISFILMTWIAGFLMWIGVVPSPSL